MHFAVDSIPLTLILSIQQFSDDQSQQRGDIIAEMIRETMPTIDSKSIGCVKIMTHRFDLQVD